MKVSVIIPVYNVRPYLEQCMDSVLQQTLDDIEVICIDDGSTDGSGEILDKYVQKDSRVKAVHQDNAGAAQARNTGLEKASGDYILFVDGDDYLTENALETLYLRALEENADVCVCDA